MNRPIILDYAVDRNGSDNKCFKYDYSKDMNVVNKGNSIIPFIDSGNNAVEIVTKTKVKRESDDEAYSNLLELSTKTEVDRESDDEETSQEEIFTKTFVERERDDEDDISYY